MSTTNKEKMNVVYIVLDDVGFSDLGCYGSEIRTPHIDSLSAGGIQYTNFNVTPLCSPTRASLLTGRNNHSVGMGIISDMDLGPEYPNTRGRIEEKAATIAEVLNEKNYGTYAIGKWHLAPSHHLTPAGPFKYWPLGKGFDRYYGFLGKSTNQFLPELVYDNHMINPPQKENYHLTEDLIDHSIQFVNDHISIREEDPFFLYIALGAMHRPHQVHKEYIDSYKGMYDKGWDQIREERFLRQKKMGIISEDSQLAPADPTVESWSDLSDMEKEVFVRFKETYSGFLTHTDEQIGKLITHLKSVDQLDNTLLVFLSDNGASPEGGDLGSTNNSAFNNGIVETVSDHYKLLEEIGGPNAASNYPKGWAQVSNTPFQKYKQNTHFGGVRVPFIVHSPMHLTNETTYRDQFHYVTDVTKTVYDLLDITLPSKVKGVEQMPLHGISMRYSFNDQEAQTKRKTQYFLNVAHRAIWDEGWKAVTCHIKGTPFSEDKWELYHVEKDYTESLDLAEVYPDKLNELVDLWWEEAEKYDALPLIDKSIELFSVVSPESVAAKKAFTYHQGVSRIDHSAAPVTKNVSYTISVPIERKAIEEDGVLVALGDRNSGYTLYILNNHLVYEYNCAGIVYKVTSQSPLPIGKIHVQMEFQKTKNYQGIASLSVNGNKEGEVQMDKTLPILLSHEGLDIGRDCLSPVSKAYEGKNEFPFKGKMEHVKFKIETDTKETAVLESIKAASVYRKEDLIKK